VFRVASDVVSFVLSLTLIPADITSLPSVLAREILSAAARLDSSSMGTAVPELLVPGFSHGKDERAA
jgi:hypothetical protein